MKIYKLLTYISLFILALSIFCVIISVIYNAEIFSNIGIGFLSASFISLIDNIARYLKEKENTLDAFFREIIHLRYNNNFIIDFEDISNSKLLDLKINKLVTDKLYSTEYMSDLVESCAFFLKNKERTQKMWEIYNWYYFHHKNLYDLSNELKRMDNNIGLNSNKEAVINYINEYIKKYVDEMNKYQTENISDLSLIKDLIFCELMNCIYGTIRYKLV